MQQAIKRDGLAKRPRMFDGIAGIYRNSYDVGMFRCIRQR